MTKRTKPRPSPRTKLGQPGRILAAFSRWLEAAPGRRVVLEHTAAGWRSTLVEGTERPATGVTLADAAAQSAQTCVCEVAAS